MSKLLEEVKKLPTTSGVYKMLSSLGEIIYVGKAKNLRSRVKSYFDNSTKNLKTKLLVENIDSFDYIVTSSELEAFALECNLIKANKPKYNVLLKDDKAFPYIKIDMKQKYPEVTVVRKIKNDGALYFGPFVTGTRISELIDLIRSAYPIRTCKHNFAKIKPLKRACLFGEIGSCSAPCINRVSEEEYGFIIKDIIEFLNGKNSKIKRELNKKMTQSASQEDFENAIKYRNLLETVKKSEEKIITSLTKNTNLDVFCFVEKQDVSAISIVLVRKGKVVAETSQFLDNINNDDDLFISFVAQYYEKNKMSDEIILNTDNFEYLESYLGRLYSKKIKISHPKIGEKKKLLILAEKNAEEYISKNWEIEERKNQATMESILELQNILGISEPILRIEGFDVSNTMGTNNVASMVVFVDGKPAKSEYRKFKIKYFEGADDYKSISEALRRRLLALKEGRDSFKESPDLILIDGGLGQLNAAKSVLSELGLDLPIISLAERYEEIYTTKSNKPLVLEKDSNAKKLLQRVRDEAHRFALGYHRNLRGKVFKSELENIEGVGKVRAKLILSRFRSSDELYNASIQELASIPTISGIIAKNIYDYIHR